jgi:hypothetical protein
MHHFSWVPLKPSDSDFGQNWKAGRFTYFSNDPKVSFRCINHRQSTHHSAFDKPVIWWICVNIIIKWLGMTGTWTSDPLILGRPRLSAVKMHWFFKTFVQKSLANGITGNHGCCPKWANGILHLGFLPKEKPSNWYRVHSPANMALWAKNSRPLTRSMTSLNADLSNKLPKSSLNRHSGTFTGEQFDCPDILTVSPTTLTYKIIEWNGWCLVWYRQSKRWPGSLN